MAFGKTHVRKYSKSKGSGRSKFKKYREDPSVSKGVFETEAEKLLRTYVKKAQGITNNFTAKRRRTVSRHHTVRCDTIDDATISAETLFNDLVFSRSLNTTHCEIMSKISYDSERIEEIKRCMRVCEIQPTASIYLRQLELLRIEYTPEYKVLGVVDEIRVNGCWHPGAERILSWGPKEIRKKRENRLISWLNGGTRSREAAWRLFRHLIGQEDSNAAHTALFRIICKYGCQTAQSMRADVLGPSQRFGYDSSLTQAAIYEMLAYQHRLEGDAVASDRAARHEKDLLAREGMSPRNFGFETSDKSETSPSSSSSTSSTLPRLDHHRILFLRRLLHRDFQTAWMFFCTLEVKRALRPELCTSIVSACFSEDEICRRVARPARALGIALNDDFEAASVEQHLLLGDYASASQSAARLVALKSSSYSSVESVLQEAKRGSLTISGRRGEKLPLVNRREAAVRLWKHCGGEAGRAAIASLFQRLIESEEKCTWLFEQVVDRMIAQGEWEYAEEIFDAGQSRQIFPKSNVVARDCRYDGRVGVALQPEEDVVDISGLSRGPALVVLRRHILEGNKALRILISNTSDDKRIETATIDAISRKSDVSSHTIDAVYRIANVLKRGRKTDVASLEKILDDDGKMKGVRSEHGSLEDMLREFQDLFRVQEDASKSSTLEVSVVGSRPRPAQLDASLFVNAVVRSITQSKNGVVSEKYLMKCLSESHPVLCDQLQELRKERSVTLKQLLSEGSEGFEVDDGPSSSSSFRVSLSRDKRPKLLSLSLPASSKPNMGDPLDSKFFRAQTEGRAILRLSVISALRQFGVTKYKETENGRVVFVGKRALEEGPRGLSGSR